MSEIAGFCSFDKDISNEEYKNSLKIMTDKLKKNDSDVFGYYFAENICLSQKETFRNF